MDALAVNHPRGEELKTKAQALREATEGYFNSPPTVSTAKFLGCWARARRLWCDLTGEPLI